MEKSYVISVISPSDGIYNSLIASLLSDCCCEIEKLKCSTILTNSIYDISYEEGLLLNEGSLTNAYYKYKLNKFNIINKAKNKRAWRYLPFNNFLEVDEISNDEYCNFIEYICSFFNITFVALQPYSLFKFKGVLELSSHIIIYIDCGDRLYIYKLINYIKSLSRIKSLDISKAIFLLLGAAESDELTIRKELDINNIITHGFNFFFQHNFNNSYNVTNGVLAINYNSINKRGLFQIADMIVREYASGPERM